MNNFLTLLIRCSSKKPSLFYFYFYFKVITDNNWWAYSCLCDY